MAYFFKLPPITDLTLVQQAALNEPNAIAISGGPGTGKSVVSLWRHIKNYGEGSRKSLLLTYTKTLEAYLAASAKSEAEYANNLAERKRIIESSHNVNRTYKWLHNQKSNYLEIIVDEAQDVNLHNYRELKKYTSLLSYGADFGQSMYLTLEELRELETGLKKLFKNRDYLLDENFRNSIEIVRFIKALFPNKKISPGRFNGPLPILILSNGNNQKEFQAIVDIINQYRSNSHNIAILLPLRSDVDRFYQILSTKISCSMYYEGMEFNEIDNVHITTFKSAKGLEFDTVIIPEFQNMVNNISRLRVIDESDYYVALTRAKRNLYLISNSTPEFLEKSEQQKSTYIKETL
jgi:DNA helicase IV